ncbi:hypothetical protein [Urechidicola croceus]|uniref:Uncharacterized protein n=1 Tax=Urechidicola croceus TaxID=1850246 RepID=A0A1D8P5T3_9FLAO|nr:hypothetical protein [Urechidicola croceus]AOW19921.1 hypothetical protein LPB138_04145 [Urechidicola croceus]
MASIKNLKKDINYVLGDVIEECYFYELSNPSADTTKAQAIIDEAISSFDSLIDRVHASDVENKKAHFKSLKADLESVATGLLEKVNNL